MKDLNIKSFETITIDIPLTDDFVISQGKVTTAQNIIIKIILENGVNGYGEITPFPELKGADRTTCLAKAGETGELIKGMDVSSYKKIGGRVKENTQNHSSVLCGFETAVLDALCRSAGLSLSDFFGGAKSGPFETDITIPILSFERSLELASQWYGRGFRKLKIKVGLDPDSEIKLITTLHSKYPSLKFIIDANQAFNPDTAIHFAGKLKNHNIPVIMFEQPVNRYDVDGLAEVRSKISFPVAADEAVFTKDDLIKVIRKNAADIVNLKIMKMGLLDAIDIAITAGTMGLKLMIGGMVETRLAMGTSLALVAGLGIIEHLDLDTPLLMASDPLSGGYYYDGPNMHLSDGPGLDMELRDKIN